MNKFDDWTPMKSHRVAHGFVRSKIISTISTKSSLIFAGNFGGEIGGWDYHGRKLYHFSGLNYDAICSIGIKQDRLLVGHGRIHVLRIPESKNGTEQCLKEIEKLEMGDANFLNWASYGSDEEAIMGHDESEPYRLYRPLMPQGPGNDPLYTPCVKTFKTQSPEISIMNLSDYQIPYRIAVPDGKIRFAWCHYGRLYIVYDEDENIRMTKFLKESKPPMPLTEYFSLDFLGWPEWYSKVEEEIKRRKEIKREKKAEKREKKGSKMTVSIRSRAL